MDTTTAQSPDRLAALEQENASLRSRLQSCERSHAVLQAEIAQYRQREQSAIAAISGLLLFIAHAREVGANAVFLFKLLLIGAAGCNAVIFHQGVFQSVDRWHDKPVVPRSAKTTAVISLLLWLAIICCGRLIAYT